MTATTTAPPTRRYAIRGSSTSDQGRAPAGAPQPSQSSYDADKQTYLARWMKVWVALLAVVTLVVVVYLVAITNSLASINDNLAIADEAVGGAGGDTATLPAQVQTINSNLVQIDTALKGVPGQADTIIGELTSIDSSLGDTNASLADTSGSLQGTSGQLVETSGILETVLGQAGNIRGTLAAADKPAGDCGANGCGGNQLGVQNIHQRVAIANGVLTVAKGDTRNIIGGLNVVNSSLKSICQKTALLRSGGSCP